MNSINPVRKEDLAWLGQVNASSPGEPAPARTITIQVIGLDQLNRALTGLSRQLAERNLLCRRGLLGARLVRRGVPGRMAQWLARHWPAWALPTCASCWANKEPAATAQPNHPHEGTNPKHDEDKAD